MASAIGPSRDGPENILLSGILRRSSACSAAMRLKILGMAFARDLDAGSSIPYIRQKSSMSMNAGRKDLCSNLSASSATIALFSGARSIFATYSAAASFVFFLFGFFSAPSRGEGLVFPGTFGIHPMTVCMFYFPQTPLDLLIAVRDDERQQNTPDLSFRHDATSILASQLHGFNQFFSETLIQRRVSQMREISPHHLGKSTKERKLILKYMSFVLSAFFHYFMQCSVSLGSALIAAVVI